MDLEDEKDCKFDYLMIKQNYPQNRNHSIILCGNLAEYLSSPLQKALCFSDIAAGSSIYFRSDHMNQGGGFLLDFYNIVTENDTKDCGGIFFSYINQPRRDRRKFTSIFFVLYTFITFGISRLCFQYLLSRTNHVIHDLSILLTAVAYGIKTKVNKCTNTNRCGYNSECHIVDFVPGYFCSCKMGYSGNPEVSCMQPLTEDNSLYGLGLLTLKHNSYSNISSENKTKSAVSWIHEILNLFIYQGSIQIKKIEFWYY